MRGLCLEGPLTLRFDRSMLGEIFDCKSVLGVFLREAFHVPVLFLPVQVLGHPQILDPLFISGFGGVNEFSTQVI